MKGYNLIENLKDKGIINSYYWFLNFDNIEKEEGNMIIGTLPHLINNKLNESNFREIPGTKTGTWGFDFNHILYGDSIELKKSYAGYINFGLKSIFGPNQLMKILDKEFFNK